MISEIYNNILYLFGLALTPELLWITIPLFIATVIMLIYLERYKEERPGWNTYVANSLVLLFVSMILFRYIYGLNGEGLINLINYVDKTIISFVVLLIGIIILFLNFEHFFPEKIAKYVSSPLTLNLIAYVFILRVYSELSCSIITFIPILIIFVVLIIVLNVIRLFLSFVFKRIKRMKESEKIEEIVSEKRPIKEKKLEIKKAEMAVRKVKKSVIAEERKVVGDMLKKLDAQKKEAVKLKKHVNE